MFHLAAYVKTNLGTTADTDIPALTDDMVAINNGHFTLGQPMDLIAAAVMSATLSRAKLASPSMRQIAAPFVRPVIAGATPGNNANVDLSYDSPYRIPAYEEIQLLASASPGTTEPFTGLIWLSNGIQQIPVGNVTPLRFTSTTAAVANAWTTLTITFADTIPSGLYAMVLSECQSTTGIAHRWIVSNQPERPGFLSYTALSQRLPYAMSMGQFGVLGRFRSNDLPRLQTLAGAADASHEGYLHVVKVGNL